MQCCAVCGAGCVGVVHYMCRLLAELRTEKPWAQLDTLVVSTACSALNHAIQSDRPRSPPSLAKAAMNGGAHHAAPAAPGEHRAGAGVALRELSISTGKVEGAVPNSVGNGRVAVNNGQKNKSKTAAAHVSDRNLDRVCKWVASKVHGGLGPDVWAVLELEVRLFLARSRGFSRSYMHAENPHESNWGQVGRQGSSVRWGTRRPSVGRRVCGGGDVVHAQVLPRLEDIGVGTDGKFTAALAQVRPFFFSSSRRPRGAESSVKGLLDA
jgi:hypothetical protein